MKEELTTLVQLQGIDLEIRRLEQEKASTPERMNALQERLASNEAGLADLKNRIEEVGRRRREVEEEFAAETSRLSKSQTKLMAVKTNREYQALLKEIEEIKKANKNREEEIIAAMAEAESLTAEVTAKEKEVAQARKEVQAEQKHVNQMAAALDKEISKFTGKRDQVATKVPEALLSRYQFLKDRREGIAVVAVSQAVCSGCHMNIPPQLFNELLRDERIFSCPWCQRFVYVAEEEG